MGITDQEAWITDKLVLTPAIYAVTVGPIKDTKWKSIFAGKIEVSEGCREAKGRIKGKPRGQMPASATFSGSTCTLTDTHAHT